MLRRPKEGEEILLYSECGRQVTTFSHSIYHDDVFLIIEDQHSFYNPDSSLAESLVLTSRGVFLALFVHDKSEIV